MDVSRSITDTMMVANLNDDDSAELLTLFEQKNPGYGLSYFKAVFDIPTLGTTRIAFLQAGEGIGVLTNGLTSGLTVGDIVILDQDMGLKLDSLMDFLVFEVPVPVTDSIPRFIRPDWDPYITDEPGGCATETNAYRRILLTWLGKNGKYLYKYLNAHRVRIADSFTHYHPLEDGFDEFYLVQMVQPGAAILTSDRYDLIEKAADLPLSELHGLMKETRLRVGDLVYLPRGVVHRGVGGVLAQVITVPGFIPYSEIGVDHHLKQISARLQAAGLDTLSYYGLAADAPLIK